MPNWSSRRLLWLIVAMAVLVRIGAALYLGDTVEILPGTHDQLSYDALAQNVAAGKGFVFDEHWYPFTPAGTPTAHWSFLYVLYLAGVYTGFGYHPLAARLIQAAAVGILMPWLLYRLGKRTFGPPVGLAAAVASAAYIYWVYYAATLMTEPFYVVAILWSLDILQRMAGPGRGAGETGELGPGPQDGGAFGNLPRATAVRGWVELGVAWGIAVLLRQQVLLLVPVLLGWLLWATWGRIEIRRFFGSAVLSLAIVAAFILPWTVRNYRIYGDFLPLNSNVGWALYAANHPIQGNRFEPLNLPKVPAEWRGLNEAELNSRLTAAGIRFVLEEPGRFGLQTLDRFRNYFRFWPERTSPPISNVSRVLSFGLYLPFMLYGLVLSVRFVRDPAYGSRLMSGAEVEISQAWCLASLLYLYAGVYSAIHLMSWAMHRYRLPVDAVMMVFVGLALVDLWRRVERWWAGRQEARKAVLS